MSLDYANQTPNVLVGSRSTSSGGTTRTSIQLESTYQTTEVTKALRSFPTKGYSSLNLDILYTMGVSETTNTIQMRLETSPDNTNWYQLSTDSTSGGTSTLTQREWTFTGADGTTKTINVIVDINSLYMRIAFKETGVASNKGSVYCEATLGGR